MAVAQCQNHRPKTQFGMAKEALMKRKLVLTAIVLSGSIGLGIQSIYAQSVPEEGERGGSSSEKMQSPAKPDRSPGTSSISSEDIMKVKVALKAKGTDPGPITGSMDSKTQQALREFQKANNLPVTGTVDQQTAAKLGVTLGSTGGASGMSGPAKEGSSGNLSGSTKSESPARPGSAVKPEGSSAKEKE
jgi:peptidoglycan hydrolase-like protein with peptidoglycan-binding domain